jgi:Arc/MetJ family transcription regulator
MRVIPPAGSGNHLFPACALAKPGSSNKIRVRHQILNHRPLEKAVFAHSGRKQGLNHPHETPRIASFDAIFDAIKIQEFDTLRTTLNIDEQLLEEAQRLTGVPERAALVREGLRALIERESARRLARLGASEPELKSSPRRRSGPA